MEDCNDSLVMKRFLRLSFDILNELAEDLGIEDFVDIRVECNKSIAKGAPERQLFWICRCDEGEYRIQSNLVKDRPYSLYKVDLYRPEYIDEIVKSFYKSFTKFIERRKAEEHVKNNGKCYFQYGLGYRGAGLREISSQDAKEKIKRHNFGKGFYTMYWHTEKDGTRSLVFNELGENDLW